MRSPTCSQHLLTWFVRRPDDGHIRTETCSLTHNKIWCVWIKLFYHLNVERWNVFNYSEYIWQYYDAMDTVNWLKYVLYRKPAPKENYRTRAYNFLVVFIVEFAWMICRILRYSSWNWWRWVPELQGTKHTCLVALQRCCCNPKVENEMGLWE